MGETAPKKRLRDFEIGVEEVILFLIIVLNIFDAADKLPLTLDYIKKIISWSALGYLFYTVSPTKLILGIRKKSLDTMITIGFFFLILKNLVTYAFSPAYNDSLFMLPFLVAIQENAVLIEIIGIYLGLALLLFVALRLALRTKTARPSVLHLLHQDSAIPKNVRQLIKRFLLIYVATMALFVIIFNLMMEWLAIAIDAPLLMIALASYFFFIIRHREKFSATSFLAKFGDFGSTFYTDVIEHLKYKKTALRVFAGFLVLHIMTDVLNYMWPFLFGTSQYYDPAFIAGHPTIWTIISNDIFGQAIIPAIATIAAIVANFGGLLFLLIFPGFLWYILYKNRPFTPKKIEIGLIFSMFVMSALVPVFLMRPMFAGSNAGVDFVAHSATMYSVIPIDIALIIALVVGLTTALLAQYAKIEKVLLRSIILVSGAFFTVYISMFFISVSAAFINIIIAMFNLQKYILLLFFALLLFINVFFYCGGLYGFLRDIKKHGEKQFVIKPKKEHQ